MQSLLNKIPFIRVFFPFALGVSISLVFNINRDFLILLVSVYFSILACYFVLNVSKRKSVKFAFGLLLNFFLFFVAVESCYLRKADNNPNHYSNIVFTNETLLSGYICDIPQLKEKSIKAKIQLTQYKENDIWKACEGNFYAYFPLATANVVSGSNVVFKNKLSAIPEPKNPFDFNYKQYLYYKNIYHQCFLKENDFEIASSDFELPISEYPLLLKSRLLEILKENNLKNDELSVTSALLLGYDDEISRDLMGAYSRTGTLHVLSVSGLHVGILFMMLNFIVRLPNRKGHLL
jgi:competence protein ComEC